MRSRKEKSKHDLHAATATTSTIGTAKAALCPLLCPPDALLVEVTAERVDVATMLAFVPTPRRSQDGYTPRF